MNERSATAGVETPGPTTMQSRSRLDAEHDGSQGAQAGRSAVARGLSPEHGRRTTAVGHPLERPRVDHRHRRGRMWNDGLSRSNPIRPNIQTRDRYIRAATQRSGLIGRKIQRLRPVLTLRCARRGDMRGLDRNVPAGRQAQQKSLHAAQCGQTGHDSRREDQDGVDMASHGNSSKRSIPTPVALGKVRPPAAWMAARAPRESPGSAEYRCVASPCWSRPVNGVAAP